MRPYRPLFYALFLVVLVVAFSAAAMSFAQDGTAPTPTPTFTLTPTGEGGAIDLATPAPPTTETQTQTQEEELSREERFRLPLSSDIRYVAEAGDTLDTIGAFFDVSVACLREMNEGVFDRDGIFHPGDELLVSVDCPPYSGVNIVPVLRENAPGRVLIEGTYTVLPNDTLDTIGQKLDVSVDALKLANDITDGRTLVAGQVLEVPEDAPPYGTFPAVRRLFETDPDDADGVDSPAGDVPDGEEYVVQPGDTLDTIGQSLDVSVVSLMVVNNLGYPNPEPIYPGDVLLVPDDAPPYGVFPALDGMAGGDFDAPANVEGETYVIQPGDTLDTIAQEFDVSVEAIRRANNIQSARDIMPGMSIVIPDDAPPYGVFPSIDQPAGGALPGSTVYVIQPGDTLDGIAALFNIDTRCLVEQNQITNPRLIKPGQSVGIPSNCPAYMGADVVPASRPDGLPNVNTNTQQAPDTTTEDTDAGEGEGGDEDSADDAGGDDAGGEDTSGEDAEG